MAGCSDALFIGRFDISQILVKVVTKLQHGRYIFPENRKRR